MATTDPIYIDDDLVSLLRDENGLHPVIPRSKVKKRYQTLFGWFGGKYYHLNWLLPLLPEKRHFIDVCGGSGVVLLNRSQVPVETYNDIDGNLVHFFRMLRDRPHELARVISLTPYSREEFVMSLVHDETLSDIERARRFFVRCRMSFGGVSQTATLGRWSSVVSASNCGMASVTSKYHGAIDSMMHMAARLSKVQIENRPAVDIIRKYDCKDILFYIDPPYVHDSRKSTEVYGYEMDDSQHRELAEALHGIKGSFALSGYTCPLMDELFGQYERVEGPDLPQRSSLRQNSGNPMDRRRESLWINYQRPTSEPTLL